MNPVAVEAAARRAQNQSAPAADLISSSAAPTGSVRIPCSMRSSTARGKRLNCGRSAIPSPRTLKWLQENHMISPEELGAIEAEVEAEIDEAVAFAENGTWEDVADSGEVRADGRGAGMNEQTGTPGTNRMTYREACRQAIRHALIDDPPHLPDG